MIHATSPSPDIRSCNSNNAIIGHHQTFGDVKKRKNAEKTREQNTTWKIIVTSFSRVQNEKEKKRKLELNLVVHQEQCIA